MAQIIRVGDPCSNEIHPIRYLRDNLPDDYTVIHNIELLVNKTWKEVDAVVITPHLVFLVDFKWWEGKTRACSERRSTTDHGTRFTMANKWLTSWNEEKASPLPKLRQNARILRGELPSSCENVHVSPLVVLTAEDSAFEDDSGHDAEFVKTLEESITEIQRRDIPPYWSMRDYDLSDKQHEAIVKTINGAGGKAMRRRRAPRNIGRWVVLGRLPSPSDEKGECHDFVVHDGLLHKTSDLLGCLDRESVEKILRTRELELIQEGTVKGKSPKGKTPKGKNPQERRKLALKALSGGDLAVGLATVVQGGRGLADALDMKHLHHIAKHFPLCRLSLHETLMYLEPKHRAGIRAKLTNAYRALMEMPPHPNILGARDAFFDADEQRFCLVLDDPGLLGTGLPQAMGERLNVVRALLAGLAHAHANGVIHRNISRDALLIGPDGGVRLTNFDYARHRDTQRTHTFAAGLQDLVNRDYAAPELFSEEGSTSASDVYSSGILIHEILTGRRPFATPAEARQDTGRFPAPPSTLIDSLPGHVDSAALYDWLQSLCAPEPTNRPPAEEALRGLEELLAPPATPLPPPADGEAEEEEQEQEEKQEVPDYRNLPTGFPFTPELTVVGRLGSPGAFGVVYRMTHRLANEDRAVKLVFLKERDAAIERVTREYKALLRLQDNPHTHIVKVFGAYRSAPPTPPHVVFELVPGETLHALFARRALGLPELWRLGIEAADALAHLHSLGIYHRDIKPDNLIWLPEGGVRIIDFNIAAGMPGMEHECAGTYRYTPPDFSLGTENPTEGELADIDVYALALILYEGWTGNYPWPGSTAPPPGIHPRHPGREGSAVDEFPGGEAAGLLCRALSPSRRDRLCSAIELRDALIDAAPMNLRDLGVDCGLDHRSFSPTVVLSPRREPPPSDPEDSKGDDDGAFDHPAPGRTVRRRGRSHVLAVGVNQYGHGWTEADHLQYAEGDATDLVETLRTHFGFEGRTLLGSEATRERILAELRTYEKRLAPDDQLLFAFFGHGEAIGREGYVLHPADGRKGDDANSISMVTINNRLAQSGSRNIAQVYDSCRIMSRSGARGPGSGGISRARVVKACRRTELTHGQVIEIAFSTSWDEHAFEHPDLQHGIFTKFLLETLMERRERRGLTFRECIAATGDKIRQWVAQTGHADQVPEYLAQPVTEDVFLMSPGGAGACSPVAPVAPISAAPAGKDSPRTPAGPSRPAKASPLPLAAGILALVLAAGLGGYHLLRSSFTPSREADEESQFMAHEEGPEDGSLQIASSANAGHPAPLSMLATPTPTHPPAILPIQPPESLPVLDVSDRQAGAMATEGRTPTPQVETESPTPHRPISTSLPTQAPGQPPESLPVIDVSDRQSDPVATEDRAPTPPVETRSPTPPPRPTPAPNSLAILSVKVSEAVRDHALSGGEHSEHTLGLAAMRLESRAAAALTESTLFEIRRGLPVTETSGGTPASPKPPSRYTLTLNLNHFEDRIVVFHDSNGNPLGIRRDIALSASAVIRDEAADTSWAVDVVEARERLAREAFAGIAPDLASRNDVLMKVIDTVTNQLVDAVLARFDALPLHE